MKTNVIRAAIATAEDGDPGPLEANPCGGGCINEAWILDAPAGGTRFFVKTNRADRAPMFAAEALALEQLAATGTVRVPRPIARGIDGEAAFLVLEALDLIGSTPPSQRELGRALAALHWNTSSDGRFGWQSDNTIGSTPQPNEWCDDWPTFFAEHRLGFQFDLAARGGHRFRGADELLARLPEELPASPPASLLHGDLWGGNAAALPDGTPVVFDPATYHGDRETDLAFTRMFGGFTEAFHRAYREAWPLDSGWERRFEIYNLYHLLNHHHLFGGGYGPQAQAVIDALLVGPRR